MVDSAGMLSLDDPRWANPTGGYKRPFDPRPALAQLENQLDTTRAWEELWEELHHQGDIGDTSYAAIPELVRVHCRKGAADWNSV
jgi:hypothetical protein